MTEELNLDKWVEENTEPPAEVLLKESEKEIKRLKRYIEKHRATELAIVNAFKEVYKDPPKLKIPKYPATRKKQPEETAVLHLSDTQIGKKTDGFNTKVAEERLNLLAQKVNQITDMRRTSTKIDEIHVYLGGDMVEGEEIFRGQSFEIDSGVFEQAAKNAPKMLTNVILSLLGNFNKVKIFAVLGNHGRSTFTGYKYTNWDLVCYHTMKWMLLSNPEGGKANLKKRLEFNIADDKFWLVDNIYGFGNLLVHGHQIKGGGGGFPLTGVTKKLLGWIDSIPEDFSYLWFGHFHQMFSGVNNHRMFLCNGSIEDSNEFAQEVMAATGYPCQRLAFFAPDHGLVSDNPIYLMDSKNGESS